jgi:hypothetical protein
VKSHLFLASLLAGVIGTGAPTAGEQPRAAGSDDPRKASALREEKGQRLPASLLSRCQKLLAMQIAVSAGTVDLHKVIEGTADKKPRPRDRRIALQLADNEKAIIVAATKAIDVLKAEGAAAAFREVFRGLRKEVKRVQRRLESSDVGTDTQALEAEVIDTLKEMIASLKKG